MLHIYAKLEIRGLLKKEIKVYTLKLHINAKLEIKRLQKKENNVYKLMSSVTMEFVYPAS